MKKILLLIVIVLNWSVTNSLAQRYERYKKLTDTTLVSNSLGYKKNISVIVPVEWQHNIDNQFPVIVVFDKQRAYNHNYILNTIDYLTSNGQMPASIILSIESEQEHRYWETLHKASDSRSKALENNKFLFEELFPMAEHKFKASSFRVLIGHSRHAYYVTALFHSQINDLNGVIALSPFIYEKNINLADSISTLDNRKLNGTKYYRYVIGNDYPEQFQKIALVESKMINDRVDMKGRLFKYANHHATVGLAITPSLYEIFEFWFQQQQVFLYSNQLITAADKAFEQEIIKHYGKQLNCSLEIINSKGWLFFNDKNYLYAIEVWENLLEKYPNFSEAYLYIIEAEKAMGKINLQTVNAFKQSLVRSDLYSDFKKIDLLNDLDKLVNG